MDMRAGVILSAMWLGVSAVVDAQVSRVPGTRVSLVSPEGFLPALQYPGFESTNPAGSIMVTELRVSSAEMIRSMTASALAAKGMTLVSSSEVSINGRPARLLQVRQKAASQEVMKWILVAGETTTAFMLVGTVRRVVTGNGGVNPSRLADNAVAVNGARPF